MNIENIYSNCFPQSTCTNAAFAASLRARDEGVENGDNAWVRISSQLTFAAFVIAASIEFVITYLLWMFECADSEQLSSAVLFFKRSIKAFVYNPFEKRLRDVFRQKGVIDPFPLLPLHPEERALLELKHLSHWLELQGTLSFGATKRALEGLPLHLAPGLYHSVAESLRAYPQGDALQAPELAQAIQKTLFLDNAHTICAKSGTEKRAWCQRAQTGKLAFLKTGWRGHVISIAFFGEYMAIGNGGQRPHDNQYVTLYKINPAKLTNQVLHQIEQMPAKLSAEGIAYFYHTLPALLSPTGQVKKDRFCRRFEAVQPTPPVTGNCTLYSLQALLPFGSVMLDEAHLSSKDTLAGAAAQAAHFNIWAALRFAEHLHPETVINDPQLKVLLATAQASLADRICD